MNRLGDIGFVLRHWPLRESDLIVSVFTREHGKIRGVAHGARRAKSRWTGALEPLTEVSLEWSWREGRELVNLTEAAIEKSPYHPMPDLEVTWTLAYLAELVDGAAQADDPDDTLYRLVRSVVGALANGGDPAVVARYAESWVLRTAGVLPDLATCAACGGDLRQDGGTWHWSLHGLGCTRCISRDEEGGAVLLAPDSAFLADVRSRAPGDVGSPASTVMRRVRRFLRHLIHDFVGRELKSERFLDELERLDGG